MLKINYAVEKINEICIPWNLCWGFSLSVIDTALISKWNVAMKCCYEIIRSGLCCYVMCISVIKCSPVCKQVPVCIWIPPRLTAQLPQANPRSTMQFELKNTPLKMRGVCYWQPTSKLSIAIRSPKHSCPLQQQTHNIIKHSSRCLWNAWHCLLCYWHTIKSFPFSLKSI